MHAIILDRAYVFALLKSKGFLVANVISPAFVCWPVALT